MAYLINNAFFKRCPHRYLKKNKVVLLFCAGQNGVFYGVGAVIVSTIIMLIFSC